MKKFINWLKAPFMDIDGKMDYRLMFIMFVLGILCTIVAWVLIQI